jgi:hypothetical protein
MKTNTYVRMGFVCLALAVSLAGCGGASEPVEAPPPAAPEPPPAPPVQKEQAEPEQPEEAPAAATVEPEFKPGMSVNDAIAAVPQGASRVNVEQEVLAAPLLKPELYAPCKARPQDHFTLRVAVWDGRVVGVDVTTKPKNDKLATCLREQVEGVTYKDKAKSLNTVEFSL